VVSPAGL